MSGAGRRHAESVAEAEQVAENLGEIDGAHIKAAKASAAHAVDAGVAEAVVVGALLRVAQNGVGFAALLELLFGRGISRIAVRVKLHRHLAIGALNLLIAGGAGNFQNFVVIAFELSSSQSLLPCELAPLNLIFGVLRHQHHGRTQKSIAQLVSAQQFLNHVVFGNLGGRDHLNRLVNVGIERDALGWDGLHPELGEHVMKLPVDQVDARAEVLGAGPLPS